MVKNILEIKNLTVEYKPEDKPFQKSKPLKAVNNLSLSVKKGEILAIAGESGCGKSTLSKAITKLIPCKSGDIIYQGVNVDSLNKKQLKVYHQSLQMIFQNPYSSLNPKMKIIDILKEPLLVNSSIISYSADLKPISRMSKEELDLIVVEALSQVGLDEDALFRYPHEFSGGQRQRIAIARALILKPDFIIADEPVSALDVSIQAQIINLLISLKQKYDLTFLFISHDLGVIRYLADRIAIMYMGEIVEIGTCNDIFMSAKHPYTKALLNAIPRINMPANDNAVLKGELPSPNEEFTGCKFKTRCSYCMKKCEIHTPKLDEVSDGHSVACFLHKN